MNLNGTPELPSLNALTALQNYLNTTGAASAGGGGAGLISANPIADPGDSGAINVDNSGVLGLVHTSGSETRTLANPTFLGQEIIVYFDEDLDAYGGLIVIDAASNLGGGDDKLTFDAVGQCVILYAVQIGGSLRWRVERAVGNEPNLTE